MTVGDRARASVAVAVPKADAFRIFTEEIDQWWRRGARFRASGKRPGTLYLETRLGGRLFEAFETTNGPQLVETGVVTLWEPPHRFSFDWRGVTFAPDEKTEVEVTFAKSTSGTLVTVTHSGFSKLRPGHPVRHGQDAVVFIRTMGLWWGSLMTSLREHAEYRRPGT